MSEWRPWAKEDDALALDPGLSAADVASRVGRSVTAVYARRQVLRGTSSRPRWRTNGFPQVARGRPGWLLAKSCAKCGLFCGAEEFSVRAGGGAQSYCRACASAVVSESLRADASRRAQFDANVRRARDSAQASALNGARNHRKHWTGPELEVLARAGMTHAEMAETLGRTLYAVRHMLQKIRAEQPDDNLKVTA